MVKRFNGLEFMGNKVNGKLTLTENTADLEGIRASIATAKKKNMALILKNFSEVMQQCGEVNLDLK
nr:hypothetical protein [Apilactobacillus ozensis]